MDSLKAKLHLLYLGFRHSKTIWLGTLIAVLGYIQQNADTLKDLLAAHPQFYAWSMYVIGGAVIALRFVTTQAVADKGKE